MFVRVWPEAYPRVEHLKCASLGLAPVLLANIRTVWISLRGTDILAYYERLKILDVKSFVTLGLRRTFFVTDTVAILVTLFLCVKFFSGCTNGATTLSITTLSITTLSIMTLSITTLSIMTLSVTTLSITLK